MRRLILAFVATLGLLQSASIAIAGASGDATAGLNYAKLYCSSCHAVVAGEQSPLAEAPPFYDVAKQPGMTATALQVWLQSSHPTMPNIVVAPGDMRNVIAYILSLKADM